MQFMNSFQSVPLLSLWLLQSTATVMPNSAQVDFRKRKDEKKRKRKYNRGEKSKRKGQRRREKREFKKGKKKEWEERRGG